MFRSSGWRRMRKYKTGSWCVLTLGKTAAQKIVCTESCTQWSAAHVQRKSCAWQVCCSTIWRDASLVPTESTSANVLLSEHTLTESRACRTGDVGSIPFFSSESQIPEVSQVSGQTLRYIANFYVELEEFCCSPTAAKACKWSIKPDN